MPVIRGEAKWAVVSDKQRARVAQQLAEELSGGQTPGGPVIFEIPLGEPNQFDVLVVWDAWQPFSSTDRSNMILDAYKGQSVEISLPLGVTYEEAISQSALPYAVVPMIRFNEVSRPVVGEIKRLMLKEGGFALPHENVDLRFPTLPLAEAAHKRLASALPQGYWSIMQSGG